MKKVIVVFGRDFGYDRAGIKFCLHGKEGTELDYGFNFIQDESINYNPYYSGKVSKLQLTELRKFIDEALQEIEKEENDK